MFALNTFGLLKLKMTEEMDYNAEGPEIEAYYQKENQLNEEYSVNLVSDIPQWAETLIELYSSPLKYEIKYQLKYSTNKRI